MVELRFKPRKFRSRVWVHNHTAICSSCVQVFRLYSKRNEISLKGIKQHNGGLVLYFEMIIMVDAWSKGEAERQVEGHYKNLGERWWWCGGGRWQWGDTKIESLGMPFQSRAVGSCWWFTHRGRGWGVEQFRFTLRYLTWATCLVENMFFKLGKSRV